VLASWRHDIQQNNNYNNDTTLDDNRSNDAKHIDNRYNNIDVTFIITAKTVTLSKTLQGVLILNVVMLIVIILNVVMLNGTILNVVMLSVLMQNVVMLYVIILNVIMLNVITLNVVELIVVAPASQIFYCFIIQRSKTNCIQKGLCYKTFYQYCFAANKLVCLTVAETRNTN
jgi:hypothetical protein